MDLFSKGNISLVVKTSWSRNVKAFKPRTNSIVDSTFDRNFVESTKYCVLVLVDIIFAMVAQVFINE